MITWYLGDKRKNGVGTRAMHEPAPSPVTPDQPASADNKITATPLAPVENGITSMLLSPVAPPRPMGRLARFVGTVLAWPHAVLRHPLRSLIIAVLLLLTASGFGIAATWLWASYHLRTGRAALEHYHTTEAVAHLYAVLKIWPRDPETLLLAARAARRSGAFDAANQFLDLYQEVRGEDEDVVLERICLRAARGEPESVANYCRSLIEENDPATPLLYEAMAQGFARSYQPRMAEMLLQKWLEQEPDNPQALYLLGQVYDSSSRRADAIKTYRAVLTADPTLDEARLRMCDALMQLGSLEEAQRHLEYLRARLSDNPKVLVYLARIQDRLDHPEEVQKLLDAALALQPHYAPALLDRGLLAMRAGQFDEAEKYLREAVQQDPSDHQAHDRLALCLEHNDKPAEADKVREHIKQMEKDILKLQAIAKGRLEQSPHDADLHYQIGMISLRAGSIAEGLRWLNSALKENPNHQGAHKALMEHYQRKGDRGKAREHQQKLIK
jgi:tetratricopeptide (TPR) repeat protein